MMDEMGVERLDVDGMTVERKMIVAASIPVGEQRSKLLHWLRSNGLDDIIKNDITVSFGKGEDNCSWEMLVGILRESRFRS